ncbi:unnamed protein product [Protopolystoma xenopodis]|uniref:Uncharacterized protein n=1 Tax=Protopolystoma xenopodis TaxID=117903 RepID=A0A448X2Z4_9PLAT|nr:unnamed protein product [Protopolystoma xenopodis]
MACLAASSGMQREAQSGRPNGRLQPAKSGTDEGSARMNRRRRRSFKSADAISKESLTYASRKTQTQTQTRTTNRPNALVRTESTRPIDRRLHVQSAVETTCLNEARPRIDRLKGLKGLPSR